MRPVDLPPNFGGRQFRTATLLTAIGAVNGIERVAICASGGSKARSAGQRSGFRNCTSNEADVLEDSSTNTVAICTPHHLHARQIVAALQAGKHVFCEKPLAVDEEQLNLIVEEYGPERSGQLLMAGYNRRFAPLAKQLKRFVEDTSEPLMMQYRVNAGYIPPDNWTQDPRIGGGRIIGEVCHFVDFLSFLCGSAILEVSAASMPDVGGYCGDNVVATLRFANGSLSTITYVANGDRGFSKERVQVFTQGRLAVVDNFRDLHTSSGGRSKRFRSRLKVDKGHAAAWQEFADSVRYGRPSPIAFDELINACWLHWRSHGQLWGDRWNLHACRAVLRRLAVTLQTWSSRRGEMKTPPIRSVGRETSDVVGIG